MPIKAQEPLPLQGLSNSRITLVDSFYKENSKKVWWNYNCLCGNTGEILQSGWLESPISSCRCLGTTRLKSIDIRFPPLEGLKINRLTFVSPTEAENRRKKKWVCLCECGKTKIAEESLILTGEIKSCGCLLTEYLEKRKSEKQKSRQRAGYNNILCPMHPNCNKDGYVPEHTLVMEEYLERFLKSNEVCHHINGERADNRLENLELWDKAHPPGQRHNEKFNFYEGWILEKCSKEELQRLFCKLKDKLNK